MLTECSLNQEMFWNSQKCLFHTLTWNGLYVLIQQMLTETLRQGTSEHKPKKMEELKSMKIALDTMKFSPRITEDHRISPGNSCKAQPSCFKPWLIAHNSPLTQLIAPQEGPVTLNVYIFCTHKGFLAHVLKGLGKAPGMLSCFCVPTTSAQKTPL